MGRMPLAFARWAPHEESMTRKINKTKAIGAAAIGSAAVAAALLYAGKRKKKNAEKETGTIPSGENPETD